MRRLAGGATSLRTVHCNLTDISVSSTAPRTVLYVGSLATTPDRDSGWISALEDLGWKVVPFSSDVREGGPGLWRKAASRLHIGRAHARMRKDLIDLCEASHPRWVHFRLPLAFKKSDIDRIRATGAVVTEYFNDDPFSPRRLPGLHMRFIDALPAYDAHFVYRAENLEAFRRAGARHVEHCPPALDTIRIAGAAADEGHGFEYDAAFIGHFERDGRLAHMEALHAAGLRLAIHGSGWGEAIRSGPLRHLYPAAPIFGARYGEIYARSSAGICFFSKLNRDKWTERPLEIVATGGVLVCERTDEAMRHFADGEEAMFFSSPSELVEIALKLRDQPDLRKRIRDAGAARLARQANYLIAARAKQVASFVDGYAGKPVERRMPERAV